MCMEDIRLGRGMSTGAFQVSLANGASTQFLGPNPKRVRLTLHTADTGARIHPEGTTAAGGNGCFLVGADKPPLTLRIEDYGVGLCGTWRGGGFGGNITLLVVETTLEKE